MRLRLVMSCSTLTLALAASACNPGPQPVAAATPQPAQAHAAVVAPAPEVALQAEQQPSEDEALRAQLLGLNKQPAADQDQAEPEQRPAPRRRARRQVPQAELRPLPMEPETSGTLSDGEFQAAVGSWRGVQSCLAQNAGHLESRNGAMQVSFQIAGDGSVADCKVVGTTTEVAQLIAPCVEKKARRIRFPSYPGSESTKVAKFVF